MPDAAGGEGGHGAASPDRVNHSRNWKPCDVQEVQAPGGALPSLIACTTHRSDFCWK